VQDLNDLYFVQVVRHGGFSAASRATGEPKSKLSKRLAQLERDLGVRLIERSSDPPAYCRVVRGRSRPRRPPMRNSRGFVLAPPI
jgi:Bacterial regulatory helix-turn-helix protein, lysR family